MFLPAGRGNDIEKAGDADGHTPNSKRGSFAVQRRLQDSRRQVEKNELRAPIEIPHILLIFSVSIDTILTVITGKPSEACLAAKTERTPTGVRPSVVNVARRYAQ